MLVDESRMRHGRPMLRPDVEVLWAAEDKLHLSFANHTVTFTSLAVTRIVDALLTEMEGGGDSDDLVDRAAHRVGVDPEMAAYVFEMLCETQCLYWLDEASAREFDSPSEDNDALWTYFASIGDDPESIARVLCEARPLVLSAESNAPVLEEVLLSGSIIADLLTIRPGTPIEEIGEQLRDRIAGGAALVAAWGLSYQSPAALIVNSVAMEGVPVLFGSCEGLVGRVGPFVIPRSTPCLECLNARLLTHSGPEELSSVSTYRLRHAHAVPRSRPTHPVFLKAVVAFFVLELQEILLNRPPRTLGGIVDFGLADGSVDRRAILRAPRCAACKTAMPPRFGWNATFPSPSVKNQGLEG